MGYRIRLIQVTLTWKSQYRNEADNSELMFKFAEQLDREETEEFMKNIYSGEEKHF